MSDFLVNNPDKPKAPKPPRKPLISPETRARVKERLDTPAAIVGMMFVPGPVASAVMNFLFPNAGVGVVVLTGGIVGGVLTALVTKSPIGLGLGGTGNTISATICMALSAELFPMAAANVTMLANTTALSNVTQSCTCTYLPSPYVDNTSLFACVCPMPQAQAAQNVTFPAHSFMSSMNATPVLGAVVGSVREAKARLSKKLKSYNI